MAAPLQMTSAMPRAMPCMLSVAMNGGNLKRDTSRPLTRPHSTPAQHARITPGINGRPRFTSVSAQIVPESASTEPMERSICPPIRINVMPMAHIIMCEDCRKMLEIFDHCRK